MVLRGLAVWGVNAALVLAASASCQTTSTSGAGTAQTSCQNRDCTVTVTGTGGSGELWEVGRTTIEYRVVLRDDAAADVRVTSRTGAGHDSDDATVRPGESAELRGYTVRYAEHSGDTATLEFTARD
ncbi:hypothetical protein [Marinactinospora rubrisoli]|uniref:Secreted protein n=1 Tax=Marinactinospora rubrisoli TaxID=2715399 RepID=A0ABW2KIL6_9ACTN